MAVSVEDFAPAYIGKDVDDVVILGEVWQAFSAR